MIAVIDTQEIIPGPNDRTIFDQAALNELAANIRENGLIQPITVRWLEAANCYQIVAGERRFRACKDILNWREIPSIVKSLSDEQASAIMLSENVARENLDPIDEGAAYASRMSLYGLTVSQIAEQAGVSSVRVHFRLKLLRLRPEVQALVRTNNLGIGYAQILADADLDENRQMFAVRKLRDNPRATPSRFRSVVNELLTQQAQGSMFEMPLMGGPQLEAVKQSKTLPPSPENATPPAIGATLREIVSNQAAFWSEAATAWNALGKPFKRQECEAASEALQLALCAM